MHCLTHKLKYNNVVAAAKPGGPSGHTLLKSLNVTRPAVLRSRRTIDVLLDRVDWSLLPTARTSGKRSSASGASGGGQTSSDRDFQRRRSGRNSMSDAVHQVMSTRRRGSIVKGSIVTSGGVIGGKGSTDMPHIAASRPGSRRSSMISSIIE